MGLHTKKISYFSLIVLLIAILIISFGISIGYGSVELNIIEIYKIIINKICNSNIFNSTWDPSVESIVWQIRMPRVLLATIVGSGLSISGIMMQSLTKNALSDPYILGISSGASTGAVLVISMGMLNIFAPIGMIGGAFIGAIISSLLVFILAGSRNKVPTTRLVLTGVAVSSLFNAITNYIIFKSHDSRTAQTALFWMTGSLSGTKWKYILPCLTVLIISIIIVTLLHKNLDILLLGEDVAITMGVDTKIIKSLIIALSTLLTGTMVAYSGPIGFIGLIIPHISRSLISSSMHKKVIPISLLLGAIVLVWSDVLARTLAPPEEIPLGIITAFIGVPFFIFLLRRSTYSFGGK